MNLKYKYQILKKKKKVFCHFSFSLNREGQKLSPYLLHTYRYFFKIKRIQNLTIKSEECVAALRSAIAELPHFSGAHAPVLRPYAR